MKRNHLANATVLALALIASPVLAQYGTTPTDQTNTSTAPNPNNTNPSTNQGTTPTGTTQSTTMDDPNATTTTTTTTTDVSTTTTTTDESLPATGSPLPTVIAVSLAAMAVGAWLSRPQPRS